MSKRKYTHIKQIEAELLAMRKAGYIWQEIADYFGLEKSQIKGWITRYSHEQVRLSAGLPPKRRGGPRKDAAPKDIVLEQQYLSMIRDLYDRSIVAYKTGTEQTINLILDTISRDEERKGGHCRTEPPQ